jgi:hypothetical protein
MEKQTFTVDEVRDTCLQKALDHLFIGDYLGDAKSHIPVYATICRDLEQRYNLKDALGQTITVMARANCETDQQEVGHLIIKVRKLYDEMTA